MVLLFLTLIPISVLIAMPIIQRLSGEADTWQGQATQGALWSLLPLGVLWTLQMLDAGSGVFSIIPCLVGLGLLLLGSSGGWPALLSGRLMQAGFASLALLSFEVAEGFTAIASAVLMAAAAAVSDTLLDRLGPAPRQPLGDADDPSPLASPELSGPLVGGIQPKSPAAQAYTPPAPEPTPPALSDRPPLPPPGAVTRWTSEQADPAWIRPRRLESEGGLSGAGDRRLPL